MAQTATVADASIDGLPQEILVRIASFLTTTELGPLRQACKHIERQLFDTFSREFFTKRQFMIEQESLEALLGISRHAGLASKLSEVIIGTDVLIHHETLLSNRALTGRVERGVLLATGLARDMLVEIFSNLPNLRTVGIRDYDGAGRVRDGPNARWRSWGWSLSSHVRKDGSDGLLPLLLAALAPANAQPTNVEVFLRRHPSLRYDAVQLPSGSGGDTVKSVLDGLRTLMLTISSNGAGMLNLSHDLAPWSAYNDRSFGEVPLRRFLHQTPKLESLRLNFEPDQFLGHRIIDWLGRPIASSSSAVKLSSEMPHLPLRLDSLRSLDLGMTNVSGNSLVRVLTKFDLESFSLWKMTLQCPGPTSTSQDCWAEFLLQLSRSLPASCRIRHIMIGSCDQYHYTAARPSSYGYRAPALRFVPEGTHPANKEEASKEFKITFKGQYTGNTVQQWLKEQSELTFVPGFHSKVSPLPSLSSESDFDEDDSVDGQADGDHDVIELLSD